MNILVNLCQAGLYGIKLWHKSTGKMLDMKSILATVFLKAHQAKDIKMSIEYHLQRPSIGVFLWSIVTQSFGGIKKDGNAFTHARDEFHKEYVLPIGQSLGYDGVAYDVHFDRDFFTPYHETSDKRVYPSIKGHSNSPLEEIRNAYNTLALMEKELLTATKIVPDLYKQLLKKK